MKSDLDALLYLLDCTLATVARMAPMKSKSKHEYNRQIAIANRGMNYLFSHRHIRRDAESTFVYSEELPECPEWVNHRLKDILWKFDADINAWAAQWEPLNKIDRRPK